MHFGFDDDQLAFRDAVRALLDKECPPDAVRAAGTAGPGGLAWSRDDGANWTLINNNNYWSVGFASPRAGWAIGTRGRITKLSGF